MHDPQDDFFQQAIFIAVKMTAMTLKQTELARTLTELKPLIAREKGCMLCTVCIEECGGRRVTMVERWRRADDLNRHIDSDHFFVLMTAVRMFTRRAVMIVSSNDSAYALDIGRTAESGEIRVWVRKALTGLCRQAAGVRTGYACKSVKGRIKVENNPGGERAFYFCSFSNAPESDATGNEIKNPSEIRVQP